MGLCGALGLGLAVGEGRVLADALGLGVTWGCVGLAVAVGVVLGLGVMVTVWVTMAPA